MIGSAHNSLKQIYEQPNCRHEVGAQLGSEAWNPLLQKADNPDAKPALWFREVTEIAVDQFYATMAKNYPGTKGDIDQGAVAAFELAASRVVSAWLKDLPAGTKIKTEDGYVFELQTDGSLTDGDIVFADIDAVGTDFEILLANQNSY